MPIQYTPDFFANQRRRKRQEAQDYFALALAAPEGSYAQQQFLKRAEFLEWCSLQ